VAVAGAGAKPTSVAGRDASTIALACRARATGDMRPDKMSTFTVVVKRQRREAPNALGVCGASLSRRVAGDLGDQAALP
jgi:hypothetical protein